jgi:hypothetical protein
MSNQRPYNPGQYAVALKQTSAAQATRGCRCGEESSERSGIGQSFNEALTDDTAENAKEDMSESLSFV